MWNYSTIIFLLIAAIVLLDGVKCIEYEDLVALNVSCDQKDSCERDKSSRFGFPLNWKERNCFCDNLCSYYGDCCINAAKYNSDEQKFSSKRQDCVLLRNYGGVYMQTKCSETWQDENISKLCKAATPQTNSIRPDPLLSIPVTSAATKFTYANLYCAVCNDDAQETVSWLPRIECPTLENESEKNLTPSSLLGALNYRDESWVVSLKVNGTEKQHRCSIDPFIPETLLDVRQCKETIASCPASYTNQETINLCNSYTSVVYHRGTAYRNYHCALCHNLSSDVMSCFDHPYTRFNFRDDFNSAAFSILLDFSDRTGHSIVGTKCSATQIWDPFFKKCRNVFCSNDGDSFRNGKCVSEIENSKEIAVNSPEINSENFDTNSLTYKIENAINKNSTHKSQQIIIFPGESDTERPYATVLNESIRSNKSLLNCNRILLPHNEFEFSEKEDSILIPKYNKILSADEYELHEGGVLVCLLHSSDEKFSSWMGWITLAGLGISFICLFLHLVAFVLVSELRNLSGKNLASLCLSLIAAYSCFILGVFGEEGKPECMILGSCMYYFFLASFCWMNVMAFDVWRTLRLATNELRVAAGDQWKKYFLYSLYAWLLPGAALGTLICIDVLQPSNIPRNYLPEMGQRLCWFGQRKALLMFFAAPLTFIMASNITFFMMAAKMIASSTQSAAKFSSCQAQQSHFKLYMRLALLMGLAWISGIMAGYLQEETLWYIFIILNTLQGAFIFGAFTCKKKILRSFCCSKGLSKRFITPDSSTRRGLESRDSNNSQISHSSEAHLTPQISTSSLSL